MLSKKMQAVLRSAIWRSFDQCYQVPLVAGRSWGSVNALVHRGLVEWRALDQRAVLVLTKVGEDTRFDLIHG